jgi:hypothetical protein
LLATYDVSNSLSWNASVFANYNSFAFSINNSTGTTSGAIAGKTVYLGASIGPEFRGEIFYIRPAIEFSRMFITLPDNSSSQGNRFNFNVHFGWILGQEKKQLNRIENKLNRINDSEKLDKLDKMIDKLNRRENENGSASQPQPINSTNKNDKKTPADTDLSK